MTLIDSSIAGQFDRLPPHSAEAEMCVLASMMLDKELIGQVVQLIRGEDFFQADHQIIYDCLTKLYEQNRPIDAVIVREELGKRGLLDEIGGTAYLAQVIGTVPSSAHAHTTRQSFARRACCANLSPPATTSSATATARRRRPRSF